MILYQKHLTAYARKLRKGGILSEVLLWQELKNDKLGYRFLRQKPINKFIVDFYCPSLKLAIEIDGASSHDNKMEKDESRQKALELLGVKVARFTDTEVRQNLNSVVENIKSEILRLINSPPPLQKEIKILRPSPSLGAPPLRKEE
ncbi:MAG: endonuclease domain-containing protein [Candidatus Liptonbacteria bacterium]|nr:endonuclease domain-containing protein [Candidatus Liptonbacteria bacterium]